MRTKQAAAHDPSPRGETLSAPTEKSFGVTFGVVFTLLAIWLAYRSGLSTLTAVMAVVAIAFLVLAYMAPAILGPLNWLWFRFGLALHAVISPIILGLLFFVVVTPTGILLRLLGKDLLGLKRREGTYWLSRDPGQQSSSMINQF